MPHQPPRIARLLLRWFVQAHFLEEVEGDLDELFDKRVKQVGARKARLYYWLDVWQTFRPYPVTRKPSLLAHELLNATFFRLALRSLLKRKVYSVLNIAGLSIGMVSFLLIMEYVTFEKSYDTFHTNTDRVFRVAFDWGETDYKGENTSVYASSVPAMGPALEQSLPEVERYTRFVRVGTVKSYSAITYRAGQKTLYQATAENGFYADANFLKVFSFPILQGDRNPLSKPGNIVLTRSYAHTIFGNISDHALVGQVLEVDTGVKENHVVAAIVDDVPENSHLKFDYLIAYATINSEQLEDNKGWSRFYTYILCKPGTTVASASPKLSRVLENLYGGKSEISIFLQPLKEIHLTSSLRDELGANGSQQHLTFLILIAYGILAMAWFNYINMFLAKAMDRVTEVGMKKILGSTRSHLIIQFFTESLVLNGVSLCVTALLFAAAQPYVAAWLGQNVTSIFIADRTWLVLVGVVTLGGCLVMGLYPAISLSAYKPVNALGNAKVYVRGAWGKHTLVYIQFVMSFVIVASTLIVARQVRFMQQADLGITLGGRLAIHTPAGTDSTYEDKAAVYASHLQQHAFIRDVTFSSIIPGKPISTSGGVQRVMGPELEGNNVLYMRADERFVPLYGIQLLAGRNFSESRAAEILSVLINEAALQTLKFESPEDALHHHIHWRRREFEIVGVVANYNHLFLKEQYEPMIIQYHPMPTGFITLEIAPGTSRQAIEAAEREMHTVFPDTPFEYEFLDTAYNAQYRDVEQFEWMVMVFAAIAISIACLGLFAVSSYVAQRRTREMAVRRVFGASSGQVVMILSERYVKIVLVSSVVGTAATYVAMKQWLQHFAFSITLGWWDFLVPAGCLLVLAWCTVSYHSVGVTRRNPARSLMHR